LYESNSKICFIGAHFIFEGFVLKLSCNRVNTVYTRNYTKESVTLTYIHTYTPRSLLRTNRSCTVHVTVSTPGAFMLTVTAVITCCSVLPEKKAKNRTQHVIPHSSETYDVSSTSPNVTLHWLSFLCPSAITWPTLHRFQSFVVFLS